MNRKKYKKPWSEKTLHQKQQDIDCVPLRLLDTIRYDKKKALAEHQDLLRAEAMGKNDQKEKEDD